MTRAELQRIAFDFRVARSVTCALELGVFAALARRRSDAAALARDLELDPRATRILLEALAAADVLERGPDGFGIPAALAPCLVEGGPGYLGNLFLHDLWHWTSWARLDQVVRQGAPATREADPHLSDPGILRRFLPNYVSAMEQSAGDSPRRVAELLAPLAPERILDLGAGTGRHLTALLARLPRARGVLVDLPFSLEQAREHVLRSELSARIEVRPLDFTGEPIPPGHDLILISRVLMGLAAERAEGLVRRCAAALEPGGCIAIHDYASDSRAGALLSLDMLVNAGGEVHTRDSICGWLDAVGLVDLHVEPVLTYTRLFIASKPGEKEP